MLGVGKSDGNSQVHCRFVVTSSLRAGRVATITWYKYPWHCWNPSNCSFIQMKSSDNKQRSHLWLSYHTLMTITYDYWVSRMWRKFGLSSSINALIYFFTYIKEHPNFEPFIFCTLGVWFTWDLKWCVRHIHVIASLYLKVRYTIKNKPSLTSENIWFVSLNFICTLGLWFKIK